MSRLSFQTALDRLLVPVGFERHGRDWIRRSGGFEDVVNLQVSQNLGSTANIYFKDLTSAAILDEAMRGLKLTWMAYPVNLRIGALVDPHFREWWRADTGGPTAMSEAVRAYALPFFESMRSLETQALRYGRAYIGRRRFRLSTVEFYLAITLYRMGEAAEACGALATPPKHSDALTNQHIEAVRRRLGCKELGGLPTS